VLSDDLKYQILQQLEKDPQISQRQLANELGMSLGKTNYCVRAVVEKGWVKVRNFRKSNRKVAYLYQLTPRGIAAKSRITRRFLDRKVEEFERLQKEIQQLRAEVDDPTP
jgi:EPS-associated MarR family transcriptional regulator